MQADEQSEDWVDRLDDLLSQRATPTEADSWLLELLRDAETFQPFQSPVDIQPDPAFADRLEARLMDEVDRLHGTPAVTHAASALPVPAVPQLQSARMVVVRSEKPTESSVAQGASGPQKAKRRFARWTYVAVAAAVLLALIGTSLAIAIHATPDSPLYGVRRLEQHVQVQLASDPVERARIQLGFAHDALVTLETIINQRDYTHYSVNLAEFQGAFQDADAAVAAVPSGSDRTALEASLTTLRGQASSDLRQALAHVNWTNRLKTTDVMGKLRNTVPIIKSVNNTKGSAPGSRGPAGGGVAGGGVAGNGLTIHIHGNGFIIGAVVYVSGQVASAVTRVTPNDIQVLLPGVPSLAPGTVIGVSNPDGTAAEFTLIHGVNSPSQGTPVSTPNTHSSDSRGSNG